MRREPPDPPLRRALFAIEATVIGVAVVAGMVSGLVNLVRRLFDLV